MDDAAEERFRQHEIWMNSFAALLTAQHEKDQRYDALIEQQAVFNRQLIEINQDIKSTLADIKTLLAHMIDRSPNGTDA